MTDTEDTTLGVATADPSTPQRKELFPPTDTIRPLPFLSPFITPDDVTADTTEEDHEAPADQDASGLDRLSKKDSRMVNKYFSHLFKSASLPAPTLDRRLLIKDGQALESISLIPLEGVKILGGPTKVLQWMALLAALKLRRSQHRHSARMVL